MRCVLWCPDGAPMPAELKTVLDRRGVGVVEVGGPCDAVANTFEEAGYRTRPALDEPVVLMLVDPTRLPEAGHVVRSVQSHLPRAVCWMYQAGANPRLRAVVESDVSAWLGEETDDLISVVRSPTPRPKAAPGLRLSGTEAEAKPSGDSGSMLTDEELSMLLGENEREAR